MIEHVQLNNTNEKTSRRSAGKLCERIKEVIKRCDRMEEHK
jgi:hypothetical protein